MLLPEFVMSLTLFLLEDNQKLLHTSMVSLQPWLMLLDQFNNLAQGASKGLFTILLVDCTLKSILIREQEH